MKSYPIYQEVRSGVARYRVDCGVDPKTENAKRSPVTQGNILTGLSIFFNWAKDRGYRRRWGNTDYFLEP
jgi:hypothetical protein